MMLDQQVLTLVSGPPPTNIEEVIALMKGIDSVLQNEDGLKWFNRMYLMVTEQVDLSPPGNGWKDPKWVLTLDVVFAGLYFRALKDYFSGAKPPLSWKALFDNRMSSGVDRIQFALAGMNAHINHDLARALLLADEQCGIVSRDFGLQSQDYEAVNGLLNTVMPAALEMLAVDTLGVLAQDTGKIGRLLAYWDLCKARELAWKFAAHLREISGLREDLALIAQDQMTGVVGRGIIAFR